MAVVPNYSFAIAPEIWDEVLWLALEKRLETRTGAIRILVEDVISGKIKRPKPPAKRNKAHDFRGNVRLADSSFIDPRTGEVPDEYVGKTARNRLIVDISYALVEGRIEIKFTATNNE